ncbi:MAG TPA: DUF5678 domain-containing protein [Patescibacteria group bacterium]|nr:DUF5678 domain-containing protein [Patescibacteria group bacterium]
MTKETDKKGHSKLVEDPNYLAYKNQEAQLKLEHMGKWVAFSNGELVGVQDTEEEILELADNILPNGSVRIHQIVEIQPVISLGGPKIK